MKEFGKITLAFRGDDIEILDNLYDAHHKFTKETGIDESFNKFVVSIVENGLEYLAVFESHYNPDDRSPSYGRRK